jgi:hypothetical protein
MPIMSTDPEYLHDRAKAAEIAGDIATAEALMQEAEDAAKALVIEAESASAPADTAPPQ